VNRMEASRATPEATRMVLTRGSSVQSLAHSAHPVE